jgi:hypothetical protein
MVVARRFSSSRSEEFSGVVICLSALVQKIEFVLLVADSLSGSGDKVKIRERFAEFCAE